jgi:hypothetical protein
LNFSYRAYGLGILSSTRIAGLEPPSPEGDPADLRLEDGPEPEWVRFGLQLPGRILSHLPESTDAADPSFVLTEHGNAECFHLSYSDGTRFVVDGTAQRVWGIFQPPLTAEDLATYFLGPVMGFLLRRLHITSLHASCVEIFGKGVALSGDAGFGKSTTAAALALRGVPVLSEDIVPLRQTAEEICVVPGYPRICLWPDAVANLLGSAQALPRLTPVWEKRYLALDGARASFSSKELPLGAIYMFAPRSPEDKAPYVQPMSPREALLVLVQNTYMNWLLDREQRAVEFDTLARLVQAVPVRRIVPHADPKRIGELCNLIVSDAQGILKK